MSRLNQRGMVFLISLGVMFLFAVLAASMLMRSIVALNVSERALDQSAAFQLADAGIDQAAVNLRTADAVDDVLAGAMFSGTYSVLSVVAIDALTQRVTTRGLSGTSQRDLEAIVKLVPQSIFRYPLFGKNSVDLKKESLTDSYDSSLGAYDPLTAGQHGDIATNGTGSSSINLRKGTAVNGQLIVGPGLADPTTAVSVAGDVVITGSPNVVSAPQALDAPPIVTTSMTCTADLNVPKDSTFTFTEANSPYCFKAINVEKNSTIAVSGNVVVYAESVDFNKHLSVNEGGKPTQFLLNIYGTDDVVIDKEGTFVGGLYVPNSRVRLKKKNEFYGAIVAKDIEIDKDSNFHYDEAISNMGPAGTYKTSIIAWRDL